MSCTGQAKCGSCLSEGQAGIQVFFKPYFAKMHTTEAKTKYSQVLVVLGPL